MIANSMKASLDEDDIITLNPWVITWCKAFPLLALPTLNLFCSDFSHSRDEETARMQDPSVCLSCRNIGFHPCSPFLASVAYHSIFSSFEQPKGKHKTNIESLDMSQDLSNNNSLGYGEILPETIIEIMQLLIQQSAASSSHPAKAVPITRGGKVVDLGSGNGTILFALSLLHPFDIALGIELVPSRHEQALRNLSIWDTHISSPQQQAPKFEFILDDFTKYSIADANLVIVHATVFDDDVMACVERQCEECAPGTWFVMVSKPLGVGYSNGNDMKTEDLGCGGRGRNASTFRVFKTWNVLDQGGMDWGLGKVYIQRRV